MHDKLDLISCAMQKHNFQKGVTTMLRWLAVVALLFASAGSAAAQNEPFSMKVPFNIHESGSFGLKTLKELGTKEAAAVVTAACAAFGGDCSKQAAAGAYLIKQVVVGDKPQGEEHHGIIRAPKGYEICKARVANLKVDAESSFSGEIVRDPGDNGLGFYAEVPKNRPEDHYVMSHLYLMFVPDGTLDQYGCWPKSDHSVAAHLWYCDHDNCKIIKPGASYGPQPSPQSGVSSRGRTPR